MADAGWKAVPEVEFQEAPNPVLDTAEAILAADRWYFAVLLSLRLCQLVSFVLPDVASLR